MLHLSSVRPGRLVGTLKRGVQSVEHALVPQAPAPVVAATAAPAGVPTLSGAFSVLAGWARTAWSAFSGLFSHKPAASEPVGGAVQSVLRQGSRGAAVMDLQRKLAAAGFTPGPVDGVFGPLTAAEVILFQRAHHLTADGVVGPQTWAALNGTKPSAPPAPAPAPQPTAQAVRRGSRGADVALLQRKLAAAGFSAGAADGDFGPRTEAAVKAFQRAHHLTADGVVGPQTWNALGVRCVAGPAPVAPAPGGSSAAQRLVANAMRFLGQPYLWGGGHGGTFSRPGPVDCSGLVQQAARMAGLNLDGTAADQQRRGVPVPLSVSALRPGDLVFVGYPAHHVGIYIGGNRVIEAPHTGDVVKIVSMTGYGWTSARRVL